MILKIENVSKKYKDKWAVEAFSTALSSGGIYGLLGPNGAGKTTLLRMLVDIAQPTAGEITLDGEPISRMGERYREIIGYLPQRFGLYNRFTARKFLLYIASLKGLRAAQAAELAQEALRSVHLEQHADQKIDTFSGGMKQRLGIAQTLLNDPRILILDEPTAGLDPKERIRFYNIIGEMGRDRMVLMSTHIIADLEYLCKEIILMKDGRLLTQATPAAIVQSMEGRVWTATLPAQQLTSPQAGVQISALAYKPDGIEARLLAAESPWPDAEPAQPRLEDAYMHYFGEEENG